MSDFSGSDLDYDPNEEDYLTDEEWLELYNKPDPYGDLTIGDRGGDMLDVLGQIASVATGLSSNSGGQGPVYTPPPEGAVWGDVDHEGTWGYPDPGGGSETNSLDQAVTDATAAVQAANANGDQTDIDEANAALTHC